MDIIERIFIKIEFQVAGIKSAEKLKTTLPWICLFEVEESRI